MLKTQKSGVLCLALAALATAGCLEGERPPITSMYGDPASSFPALPGSGVYTQESQTTVYTTPGASSTTIYTTPTYPNRPYYVQPGYGQPGYGQPGAYPQPYPPYAVPAQPGLAPGQRYNPPQAQVQCDSASSACYRWSPLQNRYVTDADATREVYGRKAARRLKQQN